MEHCIFQSLSADQKGLNLFTLMCCLIKEHVRGPTCSVQVYEDCGGGMSKQTAADVPGVPVATAGVLAGDAGSAESAAGCSGDVAICPSSD